MATFLPEKEDKLDLKHFERTKLAIENNFNILIHKMIERRDQLLVELNEMKVSYFRKEKKRQKCIKDLDQLIRGIEQTTFDENHIVQLQMEQIEKVKTERNQHKIPTPIPFPHFIPCHLAELQHRIEMFGALQDVATHYSTKLRPSRSIGREGKGTLEFDRPRGVVLDSKSNIFIADTYNGRIQVISLEGQFIREFGKGELDKPHYIALYKELAFVNDFSQNKVIKYTIENSKMVGESELELNRPYGIAVDNNEVFVADCMNNRIVVLCLDLKLIRELGNNKLTKPTDVKVNKDKVFVANSKPHNILVFSKLGDFLNSIISLGDGTGPMSLCFDKFNNILVSDYSGKTLQIYTLEGQLVHSIECDYSPTGTAVTDDYIIICVDYNADKINLY